MAEPPLDPRRQRLAALVIAALGLAGSFGAMRSTRGVCPLPDGASRRNVIAPIEWEPAAFRPTPHDPTDERPSIIVR